VRFMTTWTPENWPRQEALFDGAIDKLSELQTRIQLSSGVTPTTAMAQRLKRHTGAARSISGNQKNEKKVSKRLATEQICLQT
jgi:hypothetical protein